MSQRPEPLSETLTDTLLKRLRNQLSDTGMGVTLQEDHNGAWGQLGARHLTVRFSHGGDHIEIGMKIDSVRSFNEDRRADYDRRCPQ